MTDAPELNAQQNAFWNGPGAESWVAGQARLDAALAPVSAAAIAHAQVRPGESVLDIGCGCGATSLELAAVAAPGRVTGLDISAPMLEVARQRAAGLDNADFLLADAGEHAFVPASIDLLFSRFGVMFFGDPVAAFSNLRRALRPDGRLVFACWRAFDENHWMKLPLKAVLAHVPPLPRPGPEDPGPFAFADPDRVRRILTEAGFVDAEFTRFDFTMDLGGGLGLDEAVAHALRMGPAQRAIQDHPEAVKVAATAAVRAALQPYMQAGSAKLAAAVWLVGARRGSNN